jgi:hypothetical protein
MNSTINIDSQIEFIKTSYNGIELIARKPDGYINASKMVMSLKGNEHSRLN